MSSFAKSIKNYSDNNVTVRAKRINDIVSLDIFANNAGSTDYTVNQWNTIVTLEEKYKPTTGTVYPYIYNNATSDISKALITARILSDGKVQIYPVSGQTTLQLVGSISYIV